MLATLALAAASLSPCTFSDSAGVRMVEARCTTVSVPLDPAQPAGKVLGLAVAVIPAPTPREPGEALTVLAGGPGGSAREFYASFQRAFAQAGKHTDIVLVDQRGTGGSARMDCPVFEGPDKILSPEAARAATRQCLAVLPHDPRLFTTSVAVRDLEAVRELLGYERLHVYGASYGTRVAQHYARRYPERTASLILDGVIPPEVPLGPNVPLNAQAALETIFSRCRAQADCEARFGDLEARFAGLRRDLAASPAEFSMPHPRTGEPESVRLTEVDVAVGVRLLSYTDDSAALLPLLIHEAAGGRPQGLAAQSLLAMEGLSESLALGMHNAVVCTEDLPFVHIDEAERARLEATYLGFRQVEALQAMCHDWPRGRMDEDLRVPLNDTVPTLILSGQYDPVTPPAYGDIVAGALPDSRHLVAPGMGHGVAAAGCAPRLLSTFVRQPDPGGLDAACLDRLAPQPFFLDYSGPAP
ncbi:MAG: alpha/beta fold hydrolase [Gammaproteobacteria bacterium]